VLLVRGRLDEAFRYVIRRRCRDPLDVFAIQKADGPCSCLSPGTTRAGATTGQGREPYLDPVLSWRLSSRNLSDRSRLRCVGAGHLCLSAVR
jgi:hypothetical protein